MRKLVAVILITIGLVTGRAGWWIRGLPRGGLQAVMRRQRQKTSTDGQFAWKNATVYFAITDRFNNGDAGNDESYGRQDDRRQGDDGRNLQRRGF